MKSMEIVRAGATATALMFVSGLAVCAQQPAAQPVAANPLAMTRLKPISNADLDKLNTSGCSFSVMRGKDLIAFMDTQQPGNDKPGFKPSFWFKLDGKMVQVRGAAKKTGKDQNFGTWTGALGGQDVTIVEGKVNPKFKNDGGGQGGAAKIEWPGATGPVSTAVTWEAGC